jgi:hypothetical protein
MKNNIIKFFILTAAIVLTLGSCYDAIFHTISDESLPKEPLIKGGPTGFAVFKYKYRNEENKDIEKPYLYVASGTNLYRYREDEGWKMTDSPGGRIIQIASTNEYLYALCINDDNDSTGRIKQYKYNGKSWEWNDLGGNVLNYNAVHYIFGAGNTVFIGAAYHKDVDSSPYAITYTILYIDDESARTTQELKLYNDEGEDLNVTGLITGASYDGVNYFICTRNGSGVFCVDKDFSAEAKLLENSQKSGATTLSFAGIIYDELSGRHFIISRSGYLYSVKDETFEEETGVFLSYRMSTGAMAIWREKDSTDATRFLLTGRQDSLVYSTDSGYTYGYLEVQLDKDGVKTGSNFNEPGVMPVTSLKDGANGRYKTSIGTHPVTAIIQTPPSIDKEMTLFASTHKNGVWSYRERKSGSTVSWEWNGEE